MRRMPATHFRHESFRRNAPESGSRSSPEPGSSHRGTGPLFQAARSTHAQSSRRTWIEVTRRSSGLELLHGPLDGRQPPRAVGHRGWQHCATAVPSTPCVRHLHRMRSKTLHHRQYVTAGDREMSRGRRLPNQRRLGRSPVPNCEYDARQPLQTVDEITNNVRYFE